MEHHIKKTYGIAAIIIVLVVIAGVSYLIFGLDMLKFFSGKSAYSPITSYPAKATPDSFPQDLIQEPNPEIINSFKSPGSDGKHQDYFSYLSKKGVSENIYLYRTYLEKNGWTVDKMRGKWVLDSSKQTWVYKEAESAPFTNTMTAQKDGHELSIRFDPGPDTNRSFITILNNYPSSAPVQQ